MMHWIDNLSSYSLEILTRFFVKSLTIDSTEDYLADVQQRSISPENREKLLSWIFSVCDALGVTTYTKELAWWIVDSFLKTTPVWKPTLQLIGICAIQTAIKVNESFIVDINTLSELWGSQYSLSTILQFEEILLDKLNWNPYITTSCEILNHMKSLFTEIAEESVSDENYAFEAIVQMSEIFKSPEYTSKTAIFIQIATLDYNLSRYGAFILAIVANLWVLKSKDQLAEYYSHFLESILSMFNDEGFVSQLQQACEVATQLFGIDLPFEISFGKEDNTNMSLGNNLDDHDNNDENDDDDHSEDPQGEVCMELNQSLTSDTSQTTMWRSFTSSPLPSKKKAICSKSRTCNSEILAPADKKTCMFRKKRKAICKRNLN